MSGIGRYLRENLRHVFARAAFGRVRLLGHPGELEAFVAEAGGPEVATEIVPFSHGFYSPGAYAAWLALGARGRLAADVAFFPHYDVPPLGALPPAVVTVHDLMHFRLPAMFAAHKRLLAARVLRRAVRRAARVVTGAEHARRDLTAWMPWAAERITVVPHGVDPSFAAPVPEPALAWSGALRPYLLCVGNRKPHKNVVTAVEVLARLRARRPELRLVLAGPRFRGSDGVAERAAALGVADAVVDAGPVSEDRLRALYRDAECLLFPSLYEGFGLPVLEAMASGTPVVASDRTSVPEVVGDAGLMVEALDADAMAAAVERLWSDGALRASLVTRGRERAAAFTWEAAASRVHRIILETVPDGTPG